MDFKYEPLTRVTWLMEEYDMSKEDAEKKAAEPVCITEIAEVFYKIEGKSLHEPDYIFRTKEEVFIDEAEYSTDAFKLDWYQDEQRYHIHALSDEDFYVSDDVTEQFDADKILKACRDEEKRREGTDNPVENRYDDYMLHLEEQEEYELENEDYEDAEEMDNSELFMINIDL